MAQRSVTTTTPLGYTIATMQSAVNALISSTTVGSNISAASLQSYKTGMYDLWRGHTHTASDRTGIDTFGNITVYGVAGLTVTTTSSIPTLNSQPTPPAMVGVAPNQDITASDINSLISMVNNMRIHTHVTTDSEGVTNPTVVINNATYTTLTDSAPDVHLLSFQSNGTLVSTGAGGAVAGQWITMLPVDLTTTATYDINVQLSSGTTPTGSALNTWLNLGTTRTWTVTCPYTVGNVEVRTAVLFVQIRNTSTLVVVDTATITIIAQAYEVLPPLPITCFPAGSYVLMSDGTWKLIEQVQPGDLAMGMAGPVPVIEVDRPILGARRMMRFTDSSLLWSEEHAMWTRDSTQSQWWWVVNREMWLREAALGAIGGLTDNQTMRTGDQAVEWAHVFNGWTTNVVVEEVNVPYNTRLYVPRTSGSPIIVNGYVVGAGVNQAGFDYATLNWDDVRATLPVVQPIPTV